MQLSLDFSTSTHFSPQFPTLILCYLPILLAFALHYLSQFREPGSRQAFHSLLLYNLIQIIFIHKLWDQPLTSSFLLSARSTFILALTVSSSMILYRLKFHRLKSFPGPIKFSLSKWFMVPVDLNGQVSTEADR